MGWTKHPDALRALQGARREVYADIKDTAKAIRREFADPDDVNGTELMMHAYYLHQELNRYVGLRRAIGGHDEVDLRPYVDLLLEVFPNFKWSVHVR